jgi:hypothetical protein
MSRIRQKVVFAANLIILGQAKQVAVLHVHQIFCSRAPDVHFGRSEIIAA